MFRISNQGVVSVIHGDQPLVQEATATARETLEVCLQGGQPMAVFDLSQVPLVDSEALEMLLDMQDAFRARGGELKLAGLQPLLLDVFTATGLHERFELHEELRPAIGSFLR